MSVDTVPTDPAALGAVLACLRPGSAGSAALFGRLVAQEGYGYALMLWAAAQRHLDAAGRAGR